MGREKSVSVGEAVASRVAKGREIDRKKVAGRRVERQVRKRGGGGRLYVSLAVAEEMWTRS